MKNCPTCGAPNEIDAHFCETCGTPLDSQTEEANFFASVDNDMTIMSSAKDLLAQQEKTMKVDQAALETALQMPIEPPPSLPPTTPEPPPPPPPARPVTPDLVEKADGGGNKKMIIAGGVAFVVLALCCCCSSIIVGTILADPTLLN